MPGVLQVTFYSKGRQECNNAPGSPPVATCSESLPICWTLPTVILSSSRSPPTSPTSCMDLTVHPIILHERVSAALGVYEGEEVMFTFKDLHNSHNNDLHCYDDDYRSDSSSYNSYHDYNINPAVAQSWVVQDGSCSNHDDLFAMKVSIDPTAPFDVAIDSRHHECRPLFDGTIHYNNVGNFLCLSNGSQWKLNEQERVFRAHKTAKEFRCAGMLLQVEGVTDYYNHTRDGAGCGFCIYASTPLAHHPRPSEQMVQGYRYLGTTTNPQDAVLYGLWEALQWVFRLDFQTVWIVGSADAVFRQLRATDSMSGSTNSSSSEETTTVLIQQVQQLLDQARQLRIQFKFLSSNDTGEARDLATRAIVQQRNETWCHWSTINYQSQRNLPFSKSLARQVSI